MLAQARPLWSALPVGALQRQILAELAREGGLEPEELAKLWQGTSGSGPRSAPSRRSGGEDSPFDDGPPPEDDPSYGHDSWDAGAPASSGGYGSGSGGGNRWRSRVRSALANLAVAGSCWAKRLASWDAGLGTVWRAYGRRMRRK